MICWNLGLWSRIYRTKKGVEGYEQKDYQSHTHVYYDRGAHVYKHADSKSQWLS